jgi:predicted metalloprotease with PDZ domain
LECLIDGKGGVAYVRAKKTSPPPYSHNRIGAVFVPSEAPGSGELVAHVLTDSPAYAAGVRDGDKLLKIDGHDLTKWNTDPDLNDLINFQDSERSRISCTLSRGDKTVELVIVPRRILGP